MTVAGKPSMRQYFVGTQTIERRTGNPERRAGGTDTDLGMIVAATGHG